MIFHPKKVQDYVKQLSQCLETFYDEELGKREFEKHASEAVLSRFIAGEDLRLSEEEMEKVLSTASIETIVRGMQRKGIIDSVEDESGEEIFFLTPQAREIEERFRNSEQSHKEDKTTK